MFNVNSKNKFGVLLILKDYNNPSDLKYVFSSLYSVLVCGIHKTTVAPPLGACYTDGPSEKQLDCTPIPAVWNILWFM